MNSTYFPSSWIFPIFIVFPCSQSVSAEYISFLCFKVPCSLHISGLFLQHFPALFSELVVLASHILPYFLYIRPTFYTLLCTHYINFSFTFILHSFHLISNLFPLSEPRDELMAWSNAPVVRGLAHAGCPGWRELSDCIPTGGSALHAWRSLCGALQSWYRTHRDSYCLWSLHQGLWDDAYRRYSTLCGPAQERQGWCCANTWPVCLHLPCKFQIHGLVEKVCSK